MKGIIGKIFGYEIIEDNTVKEIRLPKEVIELLGKTDTFVEAKEYG